MHQRNTPLFVRLALLALVMLGVSYAFVPLYETFCRITGIAKPTISAQAPPKENMKEASEGVPTNRTVVVRFLANNAQTMPVTLVPEKRALRVKVGEAALTSYKAFNPSEQSLQGTAVHTMTALGGSAGSRDASDYISLQQCFCFEEQTYPAGERMNLPLSFRVLKSLPETVHTINFHYTLFPSDAIESKSHQQES